MPKTSIAVDHQLGKDEALSRIKGMLAQVKENYGSQVSDLKENWTDHGGGLSFKAMGFTISGGLSRHAPKGGIDARFPWAGKPLQGTVEAKIRPRAASPPR